jgi:biotin-(acetyl-CoA carboxylase) ligase
MLDREVVKEFLEEKLEKARINIPQNISKNDLAETFCKYIEDDYYEWLKDNFKSFFNHYQPDWKWIRGRIEYYSE